MRKYKIGETLWKEVGNGSDIYKCEDTNGRIVGYTLRAMGAEEVEEDEDVDSLEVQKTTGVTPRKLNELIDKHNQLVREVRRGS